MDKFWSGVGILILVALVLLFMVPGQVPLLGGGDVRFTDLETECRLDSADSRVSLNGKAIRFSGNFPTQHTSADLDYDYRQTRDSITLDILVEDTDSAEDRDFLNDCLASVVYDARTERLDPGEYTITLKHDGRTVESQVIEVK